jgi:hypothetical protein
MSDTDRPADIARDTSGEFGRSASDTSLAAASTSGLCAGTAERCARIAEAMRPHGGRAWSPEQSACFDALTACAAHIRRLSEPELSALRSAALQASFTLRTLLPNDPDAQLTVRLLHDAIAAVDGRRRAGAMNTSATAVAEASRPNDQTPTASGVQTHGERK